MPLRCSLCRKLVPDIAVAALRAEPSDADCQCDHTMTAIAAKRGELEAKELIVAHEQEEEGARGSATREAAGSEATKPPCLPAPVPPSSVDTPACLGCGGRTTFYGEFTTREWECAANPPCGAFNMLVRRVAEEPDIRPWTPTPEAINALPEGVRSYIHDLETNADPAGDVRRRVEAEENVAALTAKLAAEREALDRLRVWINLHPGLRTATVGLRDPHAALDDDLTQPVWHVTLRDVGDHPPATYGGSGATLDRAIDLALKAVNCG